MADPGTIHGNVVLIGAAGVLIRGAPGTGKSSLSRRLIAAATGAGGYAAWVCDDRVALSVEHGRLVATAPPTLAGTAEMRGRGVVPVGHEPRAVVRLVVDLVPPEQAERMPAAGAFTAEILGLSLARQPVATDAGDPLALVAAALAAMTTPVESRMGEALFACVPIAPGQM